MMMQAVTITAKLNQIKRFCFLLIFIQINGAIGSIKNHTIDPLAHPAEVMHTPQVIFRAQTPEESFSFLSYTVGRLPWYREQGYQVTLPTHPALQSWQESTSPLSENKIEEIKPLFFSEVYSEDAYALSLPQVKATEQTVQEGLEKFKPLQQNWGFNLRDDYHVVLTLYGPGGCYDPNKGQIILMTTEQGRFGMRPVDETILHEIVHIGIEEMIVQKHQLSHWEKERVVDLICQNILGDLFPNYRMQNKGDLRIDEFVNSHTINKSLDSAIDAYTNKYPR